MAAVGERSNSTGVAEHRHSQRARGRGCHLGLPPELVPHGAGTGTGPGVGDKAAPWDRTPPSPDPDLQKCPSLGEGPGTFLWGGGGGGALSAVGMFLSRLGGFQECSQSLGVDPARERVFPGRVQVPEGRVPVPGRRVPVPVEGSQSRLGASLSQGGSIPVEESQPRPGGSRSKGVSVPGLLARVGPAAERGPDPCWGIPGAGGASFPRGASPYPGTPVPVGGPDPSRGRPNAKGFPVPGGVGRQYRGIPAAGESRCRSGGSRCRSGGSRCWGVPGAGGPRCRSGVPAAELTGAWRSGAVLRRL